QIPGPMIDGRRQAAERQQGVHTGRRTARGQPRPAATRDDGESIAVRPREHVREHLLVGGFEHDARGDPSDDIIGKREASALAAPAGDARLDDVLVADDGHVRTARRARLVRRDAVDTDRAPRRRAAVWEKSSRDYRGPTDRRRTGRAASYRDQ